MFPFSFILLATLGHLLRLLRNLKSLKNQPNEKLAEPTKKISLAKIWMDTFERNFKLIVYLIEYLW